MKPTLSFKILCTLIILFLFERSAFSQVNLSQGLLTYYPFNGNANDGSGNGNNGLLQNGVQLTTDRFGNSNSAYAFDGIDDYITIPGTANLNPSNAMSIALFFNATQNKLQTLIGKISYTQGIGTQFQIAMGFNPYPGVLFGLNPPGTGCTGQVQLNSSYAFTGTSTPSLNQWHCLVTTFDNGIQKIYLDGALIEAINAGFSSLNQCTNSDIQIGSWWTADRQHFNGKIDDIRIYNRPINQDEVNALCATSTSTSCTNWLRLPSQPSYFKIGDLDIPGNQLTVEATFNRTAPWSGSDLLQGDLVSKHTSSSDCNYLLRPGSAEITTTNGYFKTPAICPIELNKTYHAAMVYDGSSLKFYRNGFLMSQVAASGNLVLNNWLTQVGLYANQTFPEQLVGYINEVRIWNVARTQSQIRANMDQSLPNPQTTPGLLAYYTFDNLVNKQGNATWNGSLGGSATINEVNPNCTNALDSCRDLTTNAQPSFTTPDTVCVNTPVNITNTSTGASSFYWNFCVADMNVAPSGTNLGNIGGSFASPVFMDYAFYNGNYYGFLINYNPGSLIRLDFGNSLLNTPTAVNLGNFGGIIPPASGSEGIQLVFNEGKWYAIVVGGYPPTGSTPRILKIEFGTNLNNPTPVATNWGNLGNMSQPIDLHVFKEGNNWYGLTVNAENNTITRFNFTNSFSNTPSAVNLGNIGNLAYPTGIYAINDNGFWRVFVVNAGNNTRQTGVYSLSRLDFGSSLLNTPTGINLGNPGNILQHPRDLTIMKMCDQIVGFAVNGHQNNSNIIRLNFNNDLSSTPSFTSLGIIGNSSFPHSISKLFRVNNDLYSFITNVDNNTITRLKFNGCTSSSIPNSALQTPPPIVYNTPGTYNINLTVDDGLPTQATYCRQVVVMALPHSPTKDTSVCSSTGIRIGGALKPATYRWSTGATTDSIIVNTSGTYWVESSRFGCTVRDSFVVNFTNICDTISVMGPVRVCSKLDTVVYSVFRSPGCRLPYSLVVDQSFADVVLQTDSLVKLAFKQNGGTFVKVVLDNGCKKVMDSIAVTVRISPGAVNLGPDVSSCRDTVFTLGATAGFDSYLWQDASATPDITVKNFGLYTVAAKNYCGILFKDSFNLVKLSPAPFKVTPILASVCKGESIQFSASGGSVFSWQPAGNFDNPSAASAKALVNGSEDYSVYIQDPVCQRDTVVVIPVVAKEKAEIKVTKRNDVNCQLDSTVLEASGGVSYSWTPNSYISRTTSTQVTVKPPKTLTYHLQGRDMNGCRGEDSVTVYFTKEGEQKLYIPNAFTPNGDGFNDVFRPHFTGPVQIFDFRIFNRWGQLVFQTNTPGKGWDGTFKGVIQPKDVYVYYLTAEGGCNGKFEQKGTFVLIK